jgi:serine/threonine protein kinase/tetratricopeptide (TPR) repeat protein
VNELQDRLQQALGDAYRVERELARGGMSRLFLATEASLNRNVVIKLLPPEMASEVSAARFKKEIEVAARLQHPHILPVLASGATGDLIYYVMPFVEGESLRHRLNQERQLPVDDAVDILTEVAAALAYAHQRGVVHRDIKPENILLQQGHAVLTDFGVARAVEQARGEARLTEVGVAVGTPGYMSPEQASGETNLDARSDIYALAVVGYEMLVGKPPFSGPNAQAVLTAHLTEEPAPVDQARPEIPTPVSQAIGTGLAKPPAERFQTAEEFRNALRSSTGPVAAARPSRRSLYVATAAVAFAVVLALFMVWPRGWSIKGDPRKSVIVFPFENRTGSTENDYLEEASMNLLGLAVSYWEDMRVFDDERTNSLLRRRSIESPSQIDFDAAQDMARDANVGTLVLGDIRREGDSLTIEAKVHDVETGDRITTEIVRADMSTDPRPIFDSLAVRILQLSGAPAGERPDIMAQTTRSLDAYREYLAGTAALQLLEVDSAKAHLNRAVELDSTFALAYIRLRDADGWVLFEQDPQIRRELVAKAMAYSDDLPLRYRLLVQFHSAYESGQYRRARRLAEQMIERDSVDVEAWYQLGEAHFHDEAGHVPHSDTLGNLGKALNAFERALALDSGYVLAYQHITDVLGACGYNNPWLCLADSAIYAPQDELKDRYGQATVDRERERARDKRLEAAYGWVAAAPRSYRARSTLINLLIAHERYDEVEGQALALEAEGRSSTALAWRGRVLYSRAEYAAAADMMSQATATPENIRELGSMQLIGEPINALAGGARFDDLRGFAEQLLTILPEMVSAGATNVEYPRALMAQLLELQLLAQGDLQGAASGHRVHAWLDTLDQNYEPGSDEHQLRWAGAGSTILASYMNSRDTTVLARFIAQIDTSQSRTWRTMLAHLAFERGDSATARARLEAHFQNRDSVEIAPEPGTVRLFAWADLMARLGDTEEAARAFELFDTYVQPGGWPVLHVRSWAERGAVYQLLEEEEKAIEMYERFVAAWDGGDEMVQPHVSRARLAVATLRGETRQPERR